MPSAFVNFIASQHLTVREPPPSPQNEETQTKTQTTENLNRQNSKVLQICREKETRTMVRVSSPAKLRPWSGLTTKMVMGVVPGLVKNLLFLMSDVKFLYKNFGGDGIGHF